MRIAAISDVHGNLLALETVLADIAKRAPDVIVNLGDVATSPLWPRETVELLATLEIRSVRGNHDRFLIEDPLKGISPSVRFTRDSLTMAQRRELAARPTTLTIVDGVLAVHGTPSSDSEYLLENKSDGLLSRATPSLLDERLRGVTADLILCGHSHQQNSAHASGARLVVNPGSVGCPRMADDDDPPACEASSPHARYSVLTRRAGRWSAELVILDYDWDAVAERAQVNGRPDWAFGFLGGY